MNKTEEPKPGELCKACATARAVEHYHGTPAKYCARCKPIQDAALAAEGRAIQADLLRRGVIRNRSAQEVEQDGYERALSSLRKYEP